jgi:ribosomal protein uL13
MIIDGTDSRLGRLASFAAKEALKGEEMVILNCEKVIVSGSRKNIQEEFQAKRKRVGSGQKGPKVSKRSDMIVKRAIRGMLPDHRRGRGRDAFKRIKCYVGVPKEFEDKEKIKPAKEKAYKYITIKEVPNE